MCGIYRQDLARRPYKWHNSNQHERTISFTFYKAKQKRRLCSPVALCVRRSVGRSVCLSLSQFRQFVSLAFVCHIYSIKAKSSSKWRLEKRERVNLNLVFFFSFSRRTRRVLLLNTNSNNNKKRLLLFFLLLLFLGTSRKISLTGSEKQNK